ncbi:MAG: hypothetical protein IKS36_06960 [Bacteroidales bacterium]|nr:hypothetical protein [Bacteroidales bacterium]
MRRVLLTFTLTCAVIGAFAQSTKPTVLSVADIVGNYGLDSAWVNDTAQVLEYLDKQTQDYVALTNLCVTIRTQANAVIKSLEKDYTFRDSLIWIDSNTVLSDYAIYEYRLRTLSELMGRRSILYSRLEQQRIVEEKENARLRAIEEARLAQEERNRRAADLRSNIELHHRSIISTCDGAGVTDKAKLKQLKDLYYSYLMVYNKYDLSEGNATEASISQLDQLNAFQNDLIENVLGSNSLINQIENFKNVLKMRCEKENGDIFRSYSKVFKHTNIPVSFADLREYEEYTTRLHTMVNVQQRYLQTIDLRATIAAGTEKIIATYGKRYKDESSSYREVLRTINQLPSFTGNAESILFIQNLDAFVEAQQLYLDLYPRMEDNTARADTILSHKDFPDVVAAYRSIQNQLHPLPSFKDQEGALHYEQQLNDVATVQQQYLDVLAMRSIIARYDDSLANNRRADRILSNGYRLLRKQVNLQPSFATVERGRAFLDILQGYLEMQQLGVTTMHKLSSIKDNEKKINDKEFPYSNIRKAYSRMYKAYQGIDEITNTEDLRRYSRQCDYILQMQEAFLNTMRSPMASDSDAKLRRETNIDNIKLVIGLK